MRAPDPVRAAREAARRAARVRRKVERGERARFTARHRRARRILLIAIAGVGAFVLVLGVLIFSPVFAVRQIVVEGNARVSTERIEALVADQRGTPMAMVDQGRLREELSAERQLQSFTTEAHLPDTLVVRVVERQPVAILARDGGYALVDPAGITLAEATERPEGYPLIDASTATIGSPGFLAVTETLRALPSELLARVRSARAESADSVTLTLTGGERVVWGSSEQSQLKARRLVAFMAATADQPVSEYDVSSPDNLVWR